MILYIPDKDSFLLEKQVKRFAKNKKVLDIGSGNGIQAKAALSAKAKSVLATDLFPETVKYLKEIGLLSTKSDLFNNIKEKYDLIIFNPPYLPEDKREPKNSKVTTTGGKQGDELIIKFLKQALAHLFSNGFILIVLSSLTPKHRIEDLLLTKKLNKKVLSKQKLFMEELEVWKITLK